MANIVNQWTAMYITSLIRRPLSDFYYDMVPPNVVQYSFRFLLIFMEAHVLFSIFVLCFEIQPSLRKKSYALRSHEPKKTKQNGTILLFQFVRICFGTKKISSPLLLSNILFKLILSCHFCCTTTPSPIIEIFFGVQKERKEEEGKSPAV